MINKGNQNMINETSGYVDLGDGKLFYELAGAGDPLVWVHAGFVDGRMWDDQWHDFSRHYRVIRFDMRGFGRSERADRPVVRRDDLYRLLKHLGVVRANLVGCSKGGEIVLDFALEHAEMVSAIAVVSTVPGGFELQGEPPQALFEMMAAIQSGDLELAVEMQNRLWIDGPYRQPDQVNPRVRERAAAMSRIALVNDTWRRMDSAPFHELVPPAVQRLNQIQVPLLVVAGQLDNPEILRAADVMAAGISDSRKIILPDCAHMPNMEQPEHFNRFVLDFLRG
jgi:2-hydroxy-6-oxonona-2,4-dienedioate hydrolase